MPAAITAEIDAHIGADEQQFTILRMHRDALGGAEGRQIGGDVAPRHAKIIAAHHVRREIIVLMAIEHRH